MIEIYYNKNTKIINIEVSDLNFHGGELELNSDRETITYNCKIKGEVISYEIDCSELNDQEIDNLLKDLTDE